MNRLSPLIVRRVGRLAPASAWPAPALFDDRAEPASWIDDLRRFATAWAGGMVFFLTFLG